MLTTSRLLILFLLLTGCESNKIATITDKFYEPQLVVTSKEGQPLVIRESYNFICDGYCIEVSKDEYDKRKIGDSIKLIIRD